MTTATALPPRFHGIALDHPGASERRNGASSQASLTIDRRLKSGRVDIVPLDEDDLIRVIEQAASALRILRARP